MSVSDLEREIANTVVQRFLNLQEPSPRKLLVRKYRSSQAFYQLTNARILTTVAPNAPTGEEVYLPLLLAFHYCGDPDALRLARESVSIVLRALQNLFDVEVDKTEFKPVDLEAQANKIFEPRPEPETIRLGLYLARDIGVLCSYGMSSDQTEVVSFRIAESIVDIRDFDKSVDNFISCSTVFENAPAAVETQPEEVPYAQPVDLGWDLIHPEIVRVAESRFASQHYADAAEAAFKLINERLKRIVKDRTGCEYDGVALMQKAFSVDKPVLKLGDLSTMVGQDMQVGYQQIFAGSMRGIRNPKAHANVEIDALRSMHFIFLASLLMSKVDEALSMEAPSRDAVVVAEPKP